MIAIAKSHIQQEFFDTIARKVWLHESVSNEGNFEWKGLRAQKCAKICS